jgi:hypothetical protein
VFVRDKSQIPTAAQHIVLERFVIHQSGYAAHKVIVYLSELPFSIHYLRLAIFHVQSRLEQGMVALGARQPEEDWHETPFLVYEQRVHRLEMRGSPVARLRILLD